MTQVSPTRYAHVPGPLAAAIDADAGFAAAFYARLLRDAVRVRRPARGRFAPLWSLAARHGLPEALLARSARRFPRRPRPDLDELMATVRGAWPELAARSERLPASPPRLSTVSLERPAGRIVFILGESAEPLVVLKVPASGRGRIAAEAEMLTAVEAARVAPRFLGRLDGAWAQEALAGCPLTVQPVGPATAGALGWSQPLGELASAFVRLSEATASREAPIDFVPHLDRALADPSLSARCRALVAAARRDVATLGVSVVRHRDPTVENCLFRDGRLEGLIDWEWASRGGAPGFDLWSAALLRLEASVGLARWSQERFLDAFGTAWAQAPFFHAARAGARTAARAAGVEERYLDSLEVAFFGGRLGRRLGGEHEWAVSAETAAAMLELVCAD